jgi:hypothetical protein
MSGKIEQVPLIDAHSLPPSAWAEDGAGRRRSLLREKKVLGAPRGQHLLEKTEATLVSTGSIDGDYRTGFGGIRWDT